MSCRDQIEEALAAAPAAIIRQADLERRNQAVERLAALPADCAGALEALAEEYVADLSSTSERLTIVLDAMVERGQKVADIAARALTAPGFAEREPYVELLEELAPETAAGPLQQAFDAFDEDSDADGFLRARILQALGEIGATGAVGTVTEGLAQSPRVRLAAVDALETLDARGEAPALVARVEGDEDPEVVAHAAALLAEWGHDAAVPALEKLAESDRARRYQEVRDAAAHALSRLRS
jgi:HEAT repeat protein